MRLPKTQTRKLNFEFRFLKFLEIRLRTSHNLLRTTAQQISQSKQNWKNGCAGHRFHLSLREIIANEEEAVRRAHALMVKLLTSLLRAKLYGHINVRPKANNVTSWSSVYSMIQRHIELRDDAGQLDDVNPDDTPLTTSFESRVDALTKSSKELNEVSSKLKRHECTMRQARAHLDTVLNFPIWTRALRCLQELCTVLFLSLL